MKRKRLDRDEWEQLVSQWRASGESPREFAERRGVREDRLKWWGSRLRNQSDPQSPAKLGPAAPLKFVEVDAEVARSDVSRTRGLELVLRNGRRLAFGADVEIERLTAIVRGLEER